MAHVCPMCGDFTAPSFSLLQVHLFRVHSGDFNVFCCNTQFRSAPAYRKHVQRNHSAPKESSESTSSSSISETCVVDDNNSELDTSITIPNSNALWILKLKESHKLAQSCVDSVLQDVTELCTVTISELGESVKSVINSAGLQFENIPGLQELFMPSSNFCHPFSGLSTYHHQLTFYKEHMKFVVSIRSNSSYLIHACISIIIIESSTCDTWYIPVLAD